MKYLLIVVLWTGYCALHSYLISIGFTNLMTRLLRRYFAFYRIFYVLISLILLIPLINFTAQFDSRVVFSNDPPLNYVRYILMAGSLLMFFYAFFFNYDSLLFFGIRQILDIGRESKTAALGELNRSGLLGVVRHPMYFALIVYLWCQTFRLMDIVVNTVLTVYVIIGTILEEKKLVLEFGDSYINYQKEVPMLIPFTKI